MRSGSSEEMRGLSVLALSVLLLVACASAARLSLTISTATPTDFYLNATGGSDTYDGANPGTPWATLAHACQQAPNYANGTLHIAPGTYTLSPGSTTYPCSMNWSLTSSTGNPADVIFDLSAGITVNITANVTGITFLGHVQPGYAALELFQGGGITNCLFTITSGAAVDFGSHSPYGFRNPGSWVNTVTVRYNVPGGDPSYPGVFSSWAGPSLSGLSLVNANFYGSNFGGGSAIYAATQLVMTNSLVRDHFNGTFGAILAIFSDIQLSGCSFINNTGTYAGAILSGWNGLPPSGPGLPPIYLAKSRVAPSQGGVPAPQGPAGLIPAPPSVKLIWWYWVTRSIDSSVFEYNVASIGAGAVQWSLFSLDCTITNSQFYYNTGGDVGALWIYQAGYLTMSYNYFEYNIGGYYSALVVDGSALSGNNAKTVAVITGLYALNNNVTYTSYNMDPNGPATSTVLLNHTVVQLSNSEFLTNSAPYCAHIIMHASFGPNAFVTGSYFGNSTTWDTAPVCIFGENGATGSANITMSNNYFTDTTFTATIDPWLVASQLNIFEANVSIQSHISYLSNDHYSAIAIGDYSNVTILPDVSLVNASLPGFIIFGASMELFAPSTSVMGRTSFLNLQGSTRHSVIYSASVGTVELILNATSQQTGPDFTIGGASTWLQDGTFNNVDLQLYDSTVVCCTSGNVPAQLTWIQGGGISFYAPYNWWLNNIAPVSTVAPINVHSGVVLDAVYPIKNVSQESRMTLSSMTMWSGSTVKLADAIFTGYLSFSAGSTMYLYPSMWGSRDHRVVIESTFYLQGQIMLDERFASLPFQPVIQYNPPQRYILIEAMSIFNFGTNYLPISTYVDYIEYVGTDSSITPVYPSANPTYVTVTAFNLLPVSVVDDTLSAIFMSFLVPPPYQFGCNEFAAALSVPSQFDLASLKCHWNSSTTLRISSAILPNIGDVISLNKSNNFLVNASTYGVLPPKKPVFAAGHIRPLPATVPCGELVVLDGTVSTGTGSYPYIWFWDLMATSDTNTTKTSMLSNYLGANSNLFSFLPLSNPLMQQGLYLTIDPAIYFTPGNNYTFQLAVENIMYLYTWSEQVTVNYPLSSDPTPRLSIDGPLNRTAYIGSDVTLTTHALLDSCGPSDPIVFVWSGFPGYNSASLVVLGGNFTTPGTQTFTLTAYHSLSPSDSVTVTFTVNVLVPEFSVTATSGGSFAAGHNVSLSVFVKGYKSRIPLANAGVTYSWSLLACPSVDGTQARPGVAAPTIGSYAYGSSALIAVPSYVPVCLHPNGASYPVPLLGSTTSSIVIPSTAGLDVGNWTLQCQVALFDVVRTVNVTFQVVTTGFTLPPQLYIAVPSATLVLQPNTKFVFSAIVDNENVFGLLEQQYSFQWQLVGGIYNNSRAVLNTPVLSLGYNDIISGQLITVLVSATSYATGLTSTTNTSFLPNIPPFGGAIYASPQVGSPNTTFTFKTLPWSSIHQPLRYQYSMAATSNPSNSVFLGPISESSVFIGSLSAVRRLLNGTGSTNATIIVTMTVHDALGGTAASQLEVFVDLDFAPVWTYDSDLMAIAQDLSNAANAVDVPTGFALIPPLVNSLIDRFAFEALGQTSPFWPSGVVLTTARATDATVISMLVNSSVSLARSLPVTTSTAAAVLQEFEAIASLMNYTSFMTAETNAITELLLYYVESEASEYGDGSDSAMRSLRSTMSISSLLGALQTTNALATNQTNNHLILQVTASTIGQAATMTVPSEAPLQVAVPGVLGVAQSVSINSTAPVLISHPSYPVTVTIPVSNYGPSTVPTGVITYQHVQYVGTFPNLSPRAATTVVSLTTVTANAGLSKRDAFASLITVQTLTNFTNLNGSTSGPTPLSCEQYDQQTQTWSSSGCTTSGDASNLQCDCTGVSGSPLSVLFGSFAPPPSGGSPPPSGGGNPSAPPGTPANPGNPNGIVGGPSSPSSPSHSSSSNLTIALGAGVGGGVALLVIIAIIVILTVPSLRRKVQPYFGSDQSQNHRTTNVE